VWVWWLARKLKENPLDRSASIRNQYEFDQQTGMMIHKKSKGRFCYTCLKKEPPVEAELYCQDVISGARCRVPGCTHFYDTPERIDHFAAREQTEE
jgi:hypothetical protein